MPTSAKRITTPTKRPAKAKPTITVGAINIRVRPEERALIDQAAVLSGKSRSEFMLEAARRAASDAILDRTLLRVDPAAFARFVAMLDAPPQPNEKLRKLLGITPPWG
jgi:uncharacterized protein (DUF1778 family)